MEELEILEQLKIKFGKMIEPDLTSVKYCQTSTDAFIELYLIGAALPQIVALDFYGADYEEEDEYKNEKDLLFSPEADIVDNANRFIALDEYSLIMGPDKLFTENAIDEITERNNSTLKTSDN